MEECVEYWHKLIPKAEILPISALNAYNTEYILPKLKSLLPENPPYYDKEQFTDKSERFFVNEAVREKILLNYDKEIPYSVEVVTELFKEKEGIIFIDSIIYVERDTQKGILIGHKGDAIKKVGTEARLDLEKFFGKKIHYRKTSVHVLNLKYHPNKLKLYRAYRCTYYSIFAIV